MQVASSMLMRAFPDNRFLGALNCASIAKVKRPRTVLDFGAYRTSRRRTNAGHCAKHASCLKTFQIEIWCITNGVSIVAIISVYNQSLRPLTGRPNSRASAILEEPARSGYASTDGPLITPRYRVTSF
jgi:hypothetical protein